MSKTKQIRKKKQQNTESISSNELTNLVKIVLIVCAVLLIFYFITVFVKKKDDDKYVENTVASIQYSKILVGQILNRNEPDYYVIVESEDDQYKNLYSYYLSLYSGKSDALKYYTVDLGDVFNQNHVGEQTNIKGNVSDFKFSNTTLLKISNGVITEIYDTRDEILSYFDELIK